jgi:hypothetical protein
VDRMTASVELARVHFRALRIEGARPAPGKSFAVIWVLLLWQTVALTTQVLAACLARQGAVGWAPVVSCSGLALAFVSALWVITRPRLERAARNSAVVCLGVATTVHWRVLDPLKLTGFDEQLHLRTLADIESSQGIFQANPLLAVSSRYPGLESVTALFHQLGLPVTVAVIVVVLVARLVLVLVLCDAVEHLTGSVRAGGLAVAVYAVSSQFVFFNSQFAYQTLALPLALAAVALIARARWASDPRPMLFGATVCLLAVAVTHHVTSLLTAVFLAMWTVAEPSGQARRRVFPGAVVAAVATTTWAMIQGSILQSYFGPIVDDLGSQVTGGQRHEAFSSSTVDATPLWERVFLVYYAAAVTLVVMALMLLTARSVLRRIRPQPSRPWWQPRLLLVLLVTIIPVLFAARIFPKGGEISDRSSSFLFLPLSLLVADHAVRWYRSRSRSRHRVDSASRRARFVRPLALVLMTAVFIGGYLLGSGPDWQRLPGGYRVSAEGRSMDAETLAAVRWANDALPAGSRIGAERISSVLLASQADLWPVMNGSRRDDVPSLYFADEWGQPQTELARRLSLRYLYVDQRWADELPLTGSYFYSGETPGPQKLTERQLTKFDDVPGIEVVYRHGPIVVYDLSGLGVPELRSGWFGEAHPMSIPLQLAIGLLLGLALALVGRSSAWSTVTGAMGTFRAAVGSTLTLAVGLGGLCVASVTALLTHIWLGSTVFLSMALCVLLTNPHSVTTVTKNAAARLGWKWIVVSATVAIPVAAAIALAVLNAFPDAARAQAILDDPSAVHRSAETLGPPSSTSNTADVCSNESCFVCSRLDEHVKEGARSC